MGKSINKITLLGNIGRDPETKYTSSGKAVCSFTLATSKQWTKDGQTQERTEWHNCVAWEKSGEIIAKYCTKGSKLYLEGELQTDKYEKDGQTHSSTKIIVQEFVLLDGRSNAAPKAEERGPKAEMATDDDSSLPF